MDADLCGAGFCVRGIPGLGLCEGPSLVKSKYTKVLNVKQISFGRQKQGGIPSPASVNVPKFCD